MFRTGSSDFSRASSVQIFCMKCATAAWSTSQPMIADRGTLVDFFPVSPDSTSSTINSTGITTGNVNTMLGQIASYGSSEFQTTIACIT